MIEYARTDSRYLIFIYEFIREYLIGNEPFYTKNEKLKNTIKKNLLK